ncbi:MAG: DNA polymerase III subunit gamma/tau [Anaerolineales bacterium]|nr:MAG: DNA polymerase III subunit gamma/tau [Anaerolineales bacterium]
MATQALYRKWRSRTFDEVIGQDHVTRTLQNALATDRVAHAYLFTGPRGTGKTTTARLLAKAVNCVGDADTKPCGVCNICLAVDEGRLLDMIEIDAASNRGIDEIRDLREKVGFRPGEARIKFYIIDEVHMLTDPAFNALLKTLEEPPPHVIFVLATTEPHKIPDTIVSRCQRFDFRRIPLTEIVRWLTHIAEAEGLKVEPTALEYIARQGAGSMRDAISLLDQLTAYGNDVITLAQVQAVLGAVASQAVINLADSLIDGNLARGLDVINQVVGDGAEPRQFTREFVEYLRGLLLLKMGDGASLLRASVPDETLVRMQEQAARLSPHTLLRATRLFNAAALEMRVGFLPQLPLELAFVETVMDESVAEPPTTGPTRSGGAQKQAASSTAASVPPSPQRISAPVPSPASTPADESLSAQPPAPPASPPPVGDISFDAVNDNWQDILNQLRQADKKVGVRSVKVGALIGSVLLVGVEGNHVIVEASSDWLKSRVEEPGTKMHIEQCISEVVGASARLRCVLKGEYQGHARPEQSASGFSTASERHPAQTNSALDEEGPEIEDELDSEEDPMLQEALSLGAEIKNVD